MQVMKPEARDNKNSEAAVRRCDQRFTGSTLLICPHSYPQQIPGNHIEAMYHGMIFSQDRSYVMNINGKYNK